MLSGTIIQICIISFSIMVCASQSTGNKTQFEAVREKRILDSIFETGYYDRRIRPRGEDGYTLINISLFLRAGEIDDFNMELWSDISVGQRWNDKRLKYNNEDGMVNEVRLENADGLWKPDLIFPQINQGKIQDLMTSNIGLFIYPNGDINYSARMSVSLRCLMDLQDFPFDRQTCFIIVMSYGFTNKDVVFRWSEIKPLAIGTDFYLSRYRIFDFMPGYCEPESTPEDYPCLQLELHIERIFHYYWIRIYLPYIILTTVSWVSFWLDPKAITARVLIALSTLLTMALQTYWIYTSLIPMTYTRALNLWTGTCLIFVYFALMEIATVNFFSRLGARGNRKDDEKKTEELELDTVGDVPANFERKSAEDGDTTRINNLENGKNIPEILKKCPCIIKCLTWFNQHFPSCSEKIDALSRICFPLCFFIFSLCYFVTYSSRKEIP